MTQDFIFAQDVILDPNTAKIVAVVRNGGVWRDGAKIAVLVGAQMYDLNGNLLGKLAAGAGSLPMSFKKLVEGKSDPRQARVSRIAMPHATMERRKGKLIGDEAADCTVTKSKMDVHSF
jgi:hypothetical protein